MRYDLTYYMKKPQKKILSKSTVYDPAKIESKWQKKWASSKIFVSKEDSKKQKYYVLDMFPYPSGEGLHVGHPKGYIATDVISRMKRMKGYSILHPMGFDAFGLPAENYALKTKTHPAIATKKNVARFKEQLHILGFDYDWSREVNTTDPNFYRWTQWIFLQMWKKGLAYESFEPINWCPSCKTGLANEDVEDGRCERCGTPVEKKPLRQWVLKITDYAERLLGDLDVIDKKSLPHIIDKKNPPKVGKKVIERRTVHALVRDPKTGKFIGLKWHKHPWITFVVGGVDAGEDIVEAARREVAEETGFTDLKFVQVLGDPVCAEYYAAHKDQNRVAITSAVLFELQSDKRIATSKDSHEDFEVIWLDQMKDMTEENMTCAELPVWLERLNTSSDDANIDLNAGKKLEYPNTAKPLLDWPASIVKSQKDWIGKSEGALLKFALKVGGEKTGSAKTIEVFTTRPDTLFGVTYVVLAPEHRLVAELLGSQNSTSTIKNHTEVEAYITRTKTETEIERTDAQKEKTGVELKGVRAINPANGEEVPVWIADYVLADYGTGAVMAVPAHDERDWQFAKKFGLPIKHVIAPNFGEGNSTAELVDGSVVVAFDPTIQKYTCLHWKNPERYTIVSGGREKGENYDETAKREILEEAGIKDVISWHQLGEKLFASYWNESKKKFKFATSMQYLAVIDSTKIVAHNREEHENFDVEWKSAEEILGLFDRYIPKSRHLYEIMARAVHLLHSKKLDTTSDLRKFDFIKSVPFIEPGILINSSEKFDGKNSDEVKKEITESVGGQWVTKYKLRDWVFSRQRYWGEPIPLIHCEKCGVVAVPEKDLPVKLPNVKSYEPTGTGESPLASISKWVNVKCPQCRGKGKRETNTMPQWAGSSWYYLRYEDPKNKRALVDPKKEKYWSPIDLYVGGAEHATRHLIYSRFWHKFLYDIGSVSTIEPFIKLQHVGLIMGEDGRKMSKRFGNVVNPDDVVKTYGADSMRIYEMFMGPFDQQISWSTASIIGARRFIERVWKLCSKVEMRSTEVSQGRELGLAKRSQTEERLAVLRILHKAIKKVTDDIESLRFNTAISTLMITVNELEKAASLSCDNFEILLKLLAPFAPHVADELWSNFGNKKSVHVSPWPVFDPKIAEDSTITIGVQVNGKVRATLKIGLYISENELKIQAQALPEVKKWLEGKDIKKIIVIKGKIISIVTN